MGVDNENFSIDRFLKWLKHDLDKGVTLGYFSIDRFLKWLKPRDLIKEAEGYFSIDRFLKWLKWRTSAIITLTTSILLKFPYDY